MQRFMILLAVAVVAEGCSTAPILRKQSFDFKTTALFKSNDCLRRKIGRAHV